MKTIVSRTALLAILLMTSVPMAARADISSWKRTQPTISDKNKLGLIPAHQQAPAGVISDIQVSPSVLTKGSGRALDDIFAWIVVGGTGKCTSMRIQFGDGSSAVISNYDLTQPSPIHHSYFWGGTKPIVVEGLVSCSGVKKTQVDVRPHMLRLAYYADRNQSVGNRSGVAFGGRTIRRGSIVRITDLNGGVGAVKINFGGGVLGVGAPALNPDGDSEPTPPDYPFPALRKNSLVVRIGSVNFQGGVDKTFTVTHAGQLELYVNDKNTDDNTGAWGLGVEVKEPPF